MESMNGTKASIHIPHFNALLHPETPEAQEVFRMAEEQNYKECEERILRNYFRCGANRKDLNDAGFNNFVNWNGNKNQVELYDKCKRYVENIVTDADFNKVMVLYGEPGMGKTYYGLSMIKLLCTKQKPRIFVEKESVDDFGQTVTVKEDVNVTDFFTGYYTTSEDLCALSTGRGLSGDSLAKARSTMDLYKSCKLLVIDELGRAILNAKVEKDTVFHVVNHRINNYLPTVLCTNMTEEAIEKTFGPAFYNRLKAYGLWFCVNGMENMRAQTVQKALRERKDARARESFNKP